MLLIINEFKLKIFFGFLVVVHSSTYAQYLDLMGFQRGADLAREQNYRDAQMHQQLQLRELELLRLQQERLQQEQAISALVEEKRRYGPSIPAVLVGTRENNSTMICSYSYFENGDKKQFNINLNINQICSRTGEVWPIHNRFRPILR